MEQILTKRVLLSILDQIGIDEPVRVKVNIDHLQRLEINPEPHLLQSDIDMLKKTGWAHLSVGVGLGGLKGATLSTIPSIE